MDTRNVITKENYLISPLICEALVNESKANLDSNNIDNTHKGIYLIVKVLNRQDKNLVFNYLFYDYLLQQTVMYYFIHILRSQSLLISASGKYFVL